MNSVCNPESDIVPVVSKFEVGSVAGGVKAAPGLLSSQATCNMMTHHSLSKLQTDRDLCII